jgi:hypothetical protein
VDLEVLQSFYDPMPIEDGYVNPEDAALGRDEGQVTDEVAQRIDLERFQIEAKQRHQPKKETTDQDNAQA